MATGCMSTAVSSRCCRGWMHSPPAARGWRPSTRCSTSSGMPATPSSSTASSRRRRWEAAYIDLQPSGDDPKFTELQVSDLEDLTTFVDVLAAENTEFQIKAREVDAGAEHSQNAADHDIMRGLEAELRKLKQAYEALCSEKDKEVCALKQNIEQLQVASQKKDGEIHRLRTRAKAAEAKRRLVQGKLQNMCSLTKEIGGVIEKCKDRQRETSQTRKKDMSETQKKGCSEGPAVRVETKNDSSNQMLAEGGQPEASQKRKCLAFLLDNDEQNGNDCQTTNQVVEPPKKKRVSGRNEVEKENNKEVASSKVHSESNRSPHKLAIYNALVYLRSVKDSFKNKPEKHREFQAAQSGFLSRKIDADTFISAVMVLLDGHPELILGLKSCFTCTSITEHRHQVLGSTLTSRAAFDVLVAGHRRTAALQEDPKNEELADR